KIKKLWSENFWPLFYDAEKKRKRRRRQLFANHIYSEIKRLNTLEAWSDYRFTELEAEVEAEGKGKMFSLVPFLKRTRKGLRRERSLSKALKSSQERLILLEGDPGSGKSVALRYVAQSMVQKAMEATNINTVIPIYINLKELVRPGETPIDRKLIQSFVFNSLNRVNDRDIEEFLEDEFDEGLRDGTWLFLFDSFDELPEVLSSTEADETIRSYGEAISDFLHGMNQCRGIIASRQFRGPGRLGWPRFRILPLSEERRLDLIRRANLKPILEKELIGQLGLAVPEIRSMASNPMFTGLLCEHMKTGKPFPKNSYNVFETYIANRLNRDEERLWRRFNIKPGDLRSAAESIAFSMNANQQIGLSPTRQILQTALLSVDEKLIEKFNTYLDALEFIKLARSETATASGDSKPFTFSHRRFQEYFATCVVMGDPGKVETRKLLIDARWRETAVTMCQTQPREVLTPLLNESRQIISEIIDKTPGLIENPNDYVNESPDKEKDENVKKEEILPEPFSWPQGVLHIFGLLQDGFSGHLDDLPGDIKMYAARLILSASEKGTLYDKKWGLEVAGITPHQVLLRLVRNAFAIKSQWLGEVAYRQVARLLEIPKDIANGIRMALLSLFAEKRLNRERYTVKAHISRLDKSNEFLSVLRLLLWIPLIDLILHASVFLSIFIYGFSSPKLFETYLIISLLLFISYLSLRPVIILLSMGISELNFPHYFLAMAGLLAKIYFLFGLIYQFPKLHFFLVLYFLTWAPTAGLSAKMGQFNHPLWWPFMPITPPLYLVKNAWVILYWFRKNWRKVVSFITMMLIVSFLFAILFALLDRYYWFKILFPTIVGLIGVTLSLAINFARIKNWIRWLKWKRRQHTIIPGKEFLDLLAQFKMDSIRFKFINAVREKGLLEATKENEVLIESLALAIEKHKKAIQIVQKQKIKKKDGTDSVFVFDLEDKLWKKLPKSDEFAIGDKKYIDKNRTESGKFINQLSQHRDLLLSSNRILDEIYMLLEQIRLLRRD
ncbi:MAG: NACHT domain-containing protein, partial [Candidatus Aminicenantes bacterium]